MKVLFIHPNFPAQFRYLSFALGQHPENEIVFATKNENPQWKLQGVRKALYAPSREANPSTHHYIKSLESSVLEGQAVYRLATQLKNEGFIPDLIYGHSGWGGTLFMRDLFPNTPLMCYFEWFYHAHGSDADFDPSDPISFDDELRIRMKNNSILVDLYTCQQGVSPTKWQQSQFPSEFQDKVTALHDGVDIDFFKPNPQAKLILPNLDLSHVSEIVTYVSRGMEPYRGFPQLIEAIAQIQQRRPHCHVVIVGSERVAYGKSLPDGKSYKQAMLEKFPLDLSRVHFTGSLPYNQYLRVIQASSAHIYLTRPFVLSWSMLEAMSTGCLVIGSNTAPVRELIKDGENGLLVDFFSPQAIAERVDQVLDSGDGMRDLRVRARETIVENYALKKLVPQHLKLMADLAKCSLHYRKISVFTEEKTSPPASSSPKQGMTVWFTGLSGSGKTTLSRAVANILRDKEYKVEVLDEEDVKEFFNGDLSYDTNIFQENAKRAGFLAERLTRNGIIVLVSITSPLKEARDKVRSCVDNFCEIYLKASLEVCQQRDPNQLYARANQGKIKNIPGIDAEFEHPSTPDVVCFTDQETVEESIEKIMQKLLMVGV